MQIKVKSWLASCGCVLALAFALLPSMAHAQAPRHPRPSRAPVEAPAALPLITDVKPTTDNPYGLASLWKTSDAVAKIVLAALAHHERGQLVHPDRQSA